MNIYISKNEKILFVSNIILEPYVKNTFTSDKIVKFIPYEEYLAKENVGYIKNFQHIIVIINFDLMFNNVINDLLEHTKSRIELKNEIVEKCQMIYDSIKSITDAHIMWFGFENYYCSLNKVLGNIPFLGSFVDEINHCFSRKVCESDVFIDMKHLIAEIGIQKSFDIKGKYRWNAPYSQLLVNEICGEIDKQIAIDKGITKKCIVLDCDNVLWGGILSEDGFEGVNIGNFGLGKQFYDLQIFLLHLYYRGVILAVCSKNDYEDVLKMFCEHSGMVLKKEHIACFCVNWNNKVDNIIEISKKLNIGLNSVVFIDDSYFETNLVKSQLPEVTTIQYDYKTIYEDLSCFNISSEFNLKETILRHNTYKTDEIRESLKLQYKSYDEYLKALDMKINIKIASFDEISRISELTKRTNKFTNGKRYTSEEIKRLMIKSDYKLYSVYLSDKFSDFGLVGVIGIENNILDLLSLSCRALGRSVEDEMFSLINLNNVVGFCFYPTGKNSDLHGKMEKFIKDNIN